MNDHKINSPFNKKNWNFSGVNSVIKVETKIEKIYELLGSRDETIERYGLEACHLLESIMKEDITTEKKVDRIINNCFEGEEFAVQAFGDNLRARLIRVLESV